MKRLHLTPWWSSGTVRDDMATLLTIVAKLLGAMVSNMTKLLARITLNLSCITTFAFILGSIGNSNSY